MFKGLVKAKVENPLYLIHQNDFKIEVLGPLGEFVKEQKSLRYFKSKTSDSNDIGRTKNGHSIVLKLTYGKIKILLGGELNPPAEEYLLERYTGVNLRSLKLHLQNETNPVKHHQLQSTIATSEAKANRIFQVDFAKSCHHGSADFTSEFLKAINPLATVISSGDDEPHSHPRPDTLGTIGKFSRGERSLIFSTELMRSGKEFINVKNFPEKVRKIKSITRYGMINLRTDGERAIVAQMLEQDRGATRFDIYRFEWDNATGQIIYKPKE